MRTPRLSPAMRNMLRNAVRGESLAKGLCAGPYKQYHTRRALEARGLLDSNAKPTDAGKAVFAPAQQSNAGEASPC
ncbi:hypothetical protein [Acidovorax facilis]|uniref:hypothetical protein n=1 Tax=Acidovorax facilis TaxID=12917 RepID=UPI003D651E27